MKGFLIALAVLAAMPAFAQGDCPPADLQVVLDTGWDQSLGMTIPPGSPDDDWDVIVDASGGTVPRDAGSIVPNAAWVTEPNSAWISANATGPNGVYVYESCWCMDENATDPRLSIDIRADDQAEVLLNGNVILSLPGGTFNDPTPTHRDVVDPALFLPGQNCLQVEVENVFGVVTGFNLTGEITAEDGLCCDCEAGDFVDDATTGIDDTTGLPSFADDDDWIVTVAADGGPVPRTPDFAGSNGSWDDLPTSEWISANTTGPNGLYVYEKCWCFNEGFTDPRVDIALLADDRADIYLNGNLLGSTAAVGYLLPEFNHSETDVGLFNAGENCLEVHVENTDGFITGMSAEVTISAGNAECCDCAQLPAAAEGWWSLDEASGPTAHESVNAHDGTHTNGPTPAPGRVSTALSFDGTDDFVDVPDAPGLNFGPGEDLAIDAWIRTDSESMQPIVWKRALAPNNPGYALFLEGGVPAFQFSDGTFAVTCNSFDYLADDRWHFVAVSVDRDQPNGLRLHVDGNVAAVCDPTPVTGSLVNTLNLTIGGLPNSLWFDGTIDEVELFRAAVTQAEFAEIYRANYSGKCPIDGCETSGTQTCDGGCPNGEVCNITSFIGYDACTCAPPPSPCGDTFPECDGFCDNGEVCNLNANGDACACEPPPCEETFAPECGGACDNGEICDVVPGTDSCSCIPALPCEDSPFPTCDGECPPGTHCESDAATGRCNCVPDEPLPCDQSPFPACDGECPADSRCIEDSTGTCFCEPIEPPEPCEETLFPECDGFCPAGEQCRNKRGSSRCFCAPEPPACGDAEFPVCDGLCPDDEACVKDPAGTDSCACMRCDEVPPKDDATLAFSDAGTLVWDDASCALTYRTYLRDGAFEDADGDGLADDYGACFQNDIIGNSALLPGGFIFGQTTYFLLGGQNFVGAGSVGTASSGGGRDETLGDVCDD